MSVDVIDLDSQLGQYGLGLILVGPLLGLSMSSGYRYLHVAGDGSKVYQTITFGFVQVEANALRQRADIVEKLEKRFAEVIVFDSHLEMARAVRKRWPNEETARVLTSAEQEAKAEATKRPETAKGANRPERIDTGKIAGAPPGDLRDEGEPVDYTDNREVVSTLGTPRLRDRGPPNAGLRPVATLTPPSLFTAGPSYAPSGDCVPTQQLHSEFGRDNIARALLRLESDLRPAQTPASPSSPTAIPRRSPSGDRVPAHQQRHSRLSQDDIARAILRLESDLHRAPTRPSNLAATPNQLHTGYCALTRQQRQPGLDQDNAALSVVGLETSDQLGGVQRPHFARSLTSTLRRICAVSSVALVAWAIALPSAPNVPGKTVQGPVPAPLISLDRNEASAPAASASVPIQQEKADKLALVVEPTLAGLPSVSRQQEAANEPAPQVEPTAIAPVPNQPTEANKPPPQVELAHTTLPLSPPSQAVQAEAAPVSWPQLGPTRGSNVAIGLNAEQIAGLVSRGMDFLRSGDYTSARLVLGRAAEADSASAALMLGATFDPLVIQQLSGIGIAPDVARARQWYQRAAELGSDAASQQLAKLAQSGK